MRTKKMLLVVGTIAILGLFGTLGLGRPIKWIFPNDHAGWVSVQFHNPSCPPLISQSIYLIVEIPQSKSFCTSTPLPHGLKYFRFEARQADAGTVRLQWGASGGSIWPVAYKEDSGWYLLFVGTKQQFNHNGGMPRPWISATK
jgi:hypothetical protein